MRYTSKVRVSVLVSGLLLVMSLAMALSPIGAGVALASPGWENKTPAIPNVIPVGYISAVDANIAWISGFDLSAGPIGGGATPVAIRTTNGGASWTYNAVPALPGIVFLLTAADANTAWAASMTNPATITKTADGGKTWTRQFAYGSGGAAFMKICAVDSNTVWAIGGYSVGSSIYTVALKTSDGGANWAVKVLHTFEFNPNAGFPNLVYAIPDLSACNADVAWAVGWFYRSNPSYQATFIWTTVDGGSTWTEKTAPTTVYRTLIAGGDANNAWMSDGHSIWKTSDGGSSWSVKTTQFTSSLQLSMAAFGSNVLWMGMDQGRVIRTIDGGATWVQQSPDGTGGVFLSAGDANTAWVTTGDPNTQTPYVLRTTDGGGLPAVLPPKVTSINPASGVNNANYAVEVLGSGFQSGATARLVQGATVIDGVGVALTSSGRLTCYFDLTNQPLGKYDVFVKNTDNQEAKLTGGFSVTDPCGQGGGAAISLFAGLVGLLSLAGLGIKRKRT